MLTIYGRKSSANVQKVHWICTEGNLDFKSVNVGGKYGGHTSDDFKEMNPNSTIPVLVDNEFTIYESNSIIKYIADKHNILQFSDTHKNALINQWIDWSSLVLGIQCAIFTAHTMMLPEDKRDATLASETKNKIHSSLQILDKQLAVTGYVLYDELCLADIPIGCWVHRCVILDISLTEFKYVKSWYESLKQRKSFQKSVLSAPLPPN